MATILVVEDEADIRALIAEELEDLGHEVHVESDGQAGLEAAIKLRPSIVCCDVNMPRMNGLQMKQALDEADALPPGARFIFISAQTSKSDVDDGMRTGADFYLTKPIDFDQLEKLVGGAVA